MVKCTIEGIGRRNIPNKDLVIASLKADELGMTYGQFQAMEIAEKEAMAREERKRRNKEEKDKRDCIQSLITILQNVAVSFRQSIRLEGIDGSKLLYKYDFGFSGTSHNVYWVYPYRNLKIIVLCRAGEVHIFKNNAVFDTVKRTLGLTQIGKPANCIRLEDYLPKQKEKAVRWRNIFD